MNSSVLIQKPMSTPVLNEMLEWNRAQSAAFSSPGAGHLRKLYRNQHPTEIAALKCMDGRLNLSVMTETPPGIIQPFRSMGGKFDFGTPFFGDRIVEWFNYAVSKGRRSALFVTYHFSKSHNGHLGCKGWGYDLESAQKAAEVLATQVRQVFGDGDDLALYPLIVGMETDEDGLRFHGENGTVLDLELEAETGQDELFQKFRVLYPTMHPQVQKDLFELVLGNIRHIREIRAAGTKPVNIDHAENIIAVGRGFDWLHQPNRALIIGPYSDRWDLEVVTAGRIVLSNIKEGRVNPADGVLLLCSSAFRKELGDAQRPLSEFRARRFAEVATRALKEQLPELNYDLVVGTVDMDTRKLIVLDR